MSCFDSSPWRITKDFVKLTPAVAWFVTCIAALPSYAALSWPTPIVCAVFSAIVCAWSMYDILLYKSPAAAAIYANYIGREIDASEKEV